jgi:hypothetical protein
MEISKILMVFSTVLVTLFTAILLNYGAKNSVLFSVSGISIIIVVLGINFIKFKTWGFIYQRYHLNESYPLISFFFPLIYFVAVFNGEAEFELSKTIGVSLIVIGIFVMNKVKIKVQL